VKKLIFIVLMTIAAVSTGQAQINPSQQTQAKPPANDERLRREEAEIQERRREMEELMNKGKAERDKDIPTFKAEIEVTNTNNSKKIKSVFWDVSLINRESGELIRKYSVTTRTSIAPGKSKKLKKQLPFPRSGVVNANSSGQPPDVVAKIVPVLTSVVYEDGSASPTP